MNVPKTKPSDNTKDRLVKEEQGIYDIPERYEVIGGVRYDFLSSPKYVHQKILTNFHLAFHNACSQEGEIILAPMDVHFDAENILQPDVIYIAKEHLDIIRDGYVYGVPDLVVEILSESTGRRDKTIKKQTYEHFGVGEYWLADPIYRTVDQFVLDEGRYRLAGTWTEQESIASRAISCLIVPLDAVFPAETGQ